MSVSNDDEELARAIAMSLRRASALVLVEILPLLVLDHHNIEF